MPLCDDTGDLFDKDDLSGLRDNLMKAMGRYPFWFFRAATYFL
jgi:hypothetical protein